MIVCRHYGKEALALLLQPHGDPVPGSVLSHVESCKQCQTQLEVIAKGDLDLDELAQSLTPAPTAEEQGYEGGSIVPGTDVENSNVENSRFDELGGWAEAILDPSERPGAIGRFARYEIVEILGHGGMGIVMRGYDTLLNRYSAIKVLSPELASSAAARKRFAREAKSAAAVVHPNVVPIQTVDQHGRIPYLVMPVFGGQSLEKRICESGPMDMIQVVRIAAQVADGLAAAHEQGLVHRDIKPANVLLEENVDRIQITDFGLARTVDDASMTRSGVIAGTPQYMSPEQAHGDTIDCRSDLFSLGSLIYFMVTGHSPFRAETTMGVLHRIVNDHPRPMHSINCDTPLWMEKVVMKLLAKKPDSRFQTAREVADLLYSWLAHLQQPSVVPEPRSVRSRTRGVPRNVLHLGTALSVVLAIGACASVIFLDSSKAAIRINSELDETISVRILENGKLTKRLEVPSNGAGATLPPGEYTVEVDSPVAKLKAKSNQVHLKRNGIWLAHLVENNAAAVNDQSTIGGSQANKAPKGKQIIASQNGIIGLLPGERVLWEAALGSETMRAPVVDHEHVYVGSNNHHGYSDHYPADVDLGVLLCFRKSDGEFLWQHSNEKLPTGRVHDWPLQGVCSRPCIEGDRLWYVNNRAEIVCLDTKGFRDGQNDGYVRDEKHRSDNDADVIWRFDMMRRLGVQPHNVSTCTIAVWEDRIFAVTGNGVDESHTPPLAYAPSFIAVDKRTGNCCGRG